MKKAKLFLIAPMLLLLLGGCGSKAPSSNKIKYTEAESNMHIYIESLFIRDGFAYGYGYKIKSGVWYHNGNTTGMSVLEYCIYDNQNIYIRLHSPDLAYFGGESKENIPTEHTYEYHGVLSYTIKTTSY